MNKPEHYDTGAVDPLDLIAAAGFTVFEGFCRGNVIKYVFRYSTKGRLSDLAKARVYLDWLEILEKYRSQTLEKTKFEPVKLPPLDELKKMYSDLVLHTRY